MAEGLKPCPFCGEEAETHQSFIPWTGEFYWVVGCEGSYGSGCPGYVWKLTPMYLTEEHAVRAWNRRANDDQGADGREDHANTAGD